MLDGWFGDPCCRRHRRGCHAEDWGTGWAPARSLHQFRHVTQLSSRKDGTCLVSSRTWVEEVEAVYGAHGGRLFPIVGEHGTYHLGVVTRYRHLGGIVHHACDAGQEARQRIAVAHQTFTQQRRLLYGNPSLTLTSRIQMFDAIVCSALTYGAEWWVLNTDLDKHDTHMCTGVMKLYKRLLRYNPGNKLTDEEILSQLQLPYPTELLRRTRLRYLGTIFSQDIKIEWGLLAQDAQWIELVRDDLQWIWTQLHHTTKLVH